MFATARLSCRVLAVANSCRRGICTKSLRSLGAVGFNGRVGGTVNVSHQIRYDSSSSQKPQNWKALSNEDWAERLSPEAYFCTREGGTEPPFTGLYVNHKAEGIYKCVCCGSELFTSKSKYDSKSGWPSFHSPAEEGSVTKRKDISYGMIRIEILCSNCDSHLGHVFDDGPEPTGQRYCINSVCLKFSPKKIN